MLFDEQTIRLVDTLNFSQPESVTFRFVTAVRPAIIGKSVRFGTLRMTWEGELSASTSAAGHGLTIVELTSATPVLDKIFTFNFECL